MRRVRSGCGVWCLLNVERYGVEEDGDGEEDAMMRMGMRMMRKKCKLLFSLLFACEAGVRRVCAEGRK